MLWVTRTLGKRFCLACVCFAFLVFSYWYFLGIIPPQLMEPRHMIGTSFSQPMINPQLTTRSDNTKTPAARGVSLQTSSASAPSAAKSGCGLGFVEIIAGLAACCCLTTFGALMGAKKLVGAVFNKVKSAPPAQDEAAEV